MGATIAATLGATIGLKWVCKVALLLPKTEKSRPVIPR